MSVDSTGTSHPSQLDVVLGGGLVAGFPNEKPSVVKRERYHLDSAKNKKATLAVGWLK